MNAKTIFIPTFARYPTRFFMQMVKATRLDQVYSAFSTRPLAIEELDEYYLNTALATQARHFPKNKPSAQLFINSYPYLCKSEFTIQIYKQ